MVHATLKQSKQNLSKPIIKWTVCVEQEQHNKSLFIPSKKVSKFMKHRDVKCFWELQLS